MHSVTTRKKFGSSPIQLKRKSGFFLKRVDFQWVLRIEKISYCQAVPCPSKKAFASPKKAVIPLFSMRASAVSARISLSPRVSLRKRRGEYWVAFSRPFLSSVPAFLPGQQGNGSERPTKLEMNRIFLKKLFRKSLPASLFQREGGFLKAFNKRSPFSPL